MDNAAFGSFLQVLPPVEFACVYGSSLHPSNRDKTTMTDYILGVADPKQWHSENLKLNKHHYASWMVHLGGERLITGVADKIGVGVHFNPFVSWNGKVHIVVDNLDVNSTNSVNLRAAVSAALLLLPSEFTEEDLYAKVCSLSYMGDVRMLFAEDKNKVKKIVSGQFDLFHSMYKPFLEEYEAKKLLRLSSTANNQIHISQDCDFSVDYSIVSALPPLIRNQIRMKEGEKEKIWETGRAINDTRNSLREGAANCLQRILRRRVMISSARQAVSGVLAVGAVNASRYLAKKVSKAWKSWR
ncbi:hypothetical protein PHAVU_002G188100 [Phaseolus vulgaris]|uniref:uncharacterized protein isoform X2 n=1 Tax=Phaseolus vulgaris TaxID=3885 RepID=UPI0035CBE3F4